MKHVALSLFIAVLLSSCARFTVPFDGMSIGPQDATNPCHDEDPCTIDVVTWKVDPKSHLHYDSVCLNLTVDSCIMFCDTADCDDRTFCTDDWCDTTRQICQQQYACNDNDDCTTDDCVGLYCLYEPVNCLDNSLCTNDFCLNGICQHHSVNCDDGNTCTMDACVPQDGTCEYIDTCASLCAFDTMPNPNIDDWCKVVVCLNGYEWNATRDCNDGDPCTNDYCAAEQCWNAPVNCEDGSGCVDAGTCWCENGYCLYGMNKTKDAGDDANMIYLHSIDGKLLEVILPDRILPFAMMFAHSDYPSGMYLLKSGSRTTKLIKP